MSAHRWIRNAVTRRAAWFALAVVGLDQLTKLTATLAAAGQTSGLLVPVHNPRFSLGVAAASPPVMVLVMAAGIAAAGGHTLRAATRGRPGRRPGFRDC
jgi:hypothetical protein